MNDLRRRTETSGRPSPSQRGYAEQPGEGRKTSQPGERDPQNGQPADRLGQGARHCPQQ
ncbi:MULTISPECIES: hypothetical protein [Cupriavidus]|uniref:hypothetical protein n=1 Tax=Cupriavidus TaxID=106589 RepID=UPI00036106B4|nr:MULTISPECIES: hypothetical protein [Cupriavidus]